MINTTDSCGRRPEPEFIRAERRSNGLTQTAAAQLVHCSMRAWQEWEAGTRRMPPGLWELFLMKTQASAARKSA
jgi:putative transcriptional regulator